MATQRHRSSAVPLAWLYAALIVYASLYPFAGWRVPGVGPLDFLIDRAHGWTWFDWISNLLGYLPLGFLLFVALVRSGRTSAAAAWTALVGGTMLTFTLELLQNYLPHRVSSNLDLLLNAMGTALGIGIGLLLDSHGGIERWQMVRDRWFVARSAGGMALLLLWPIGLLFPTAVPFGLGQVLGRVQPVVADMLRGTSAEGWAARWAEAAAATPAESVTTMSAASELSIIVLGLLAPCLVAFTIAVPGWRRSALVIGAALLGAAATTLSTALNFGPQHALAWTTAQAIQGVLVGLAAAALLSLVPRRVAAGFGLITLTALVMLVARAPADPYFGQSLQSWEQGRFIRFHGAAQWVGWIWPYAALCYLLARLAAREPIR